MAKIHIDDELIRHLAGLLRETGLTEIELGSGRERVRVSRSNLGLSSNPGPASVNKPTSDTVPAIRLTDEVGMEHPGAVTAPMVGTVYLAPEPGAKPYINVGDDVQAGDTMFIIEAMKTMNPVGAPRSGRVEQVLVGNASPVEYGEVLALVG